MTETAFNLQSLTAFHCGLFAAFYIVVGVALFTYHKNTKGAIALALVSISSGFAHIFGFLLDSFAPDNVNLSIGLASYYTWASPTVMLCLKEAISPGWLTWEKYLRYISPFLLGTILCLIFGNIYILNILTGLDIFATVYCAFVLRKGIDLREKVVKEYFTDINTFGHGWVKGFMYFQVLTAICLYPLFTNHNVYIGIIWNYIQGGYWLYFLLKCREQRYYSTQIPDDIQKDLDEIDKQIDGRKEVKKDEEQIIPEAEAGEKMMISSETMEYIEKRLHELEEQKVFLTESLNLASLAQEVGTNRTYMSVFFRTKETTFWDYINGKRCEHAIEIMKARPSVTMAELSHLSGYKTENCFRSSFTTLYGKTPFVYKREMKSSEKEN